MLMLLAGGLVVAVVMGIGVLQIAGESRIGWIFPIISVATLAWYLMHLAFSGPTNR